MRRRAIQRDQVWTIRRGDQPDYERPSYIEKQKADIHASNCFRNIPARVLGFPSRDLKSIHSIKCRRRRGRGKVRKLTATTSVPTNENAACESTASHPKS